MSEEYSDLNGFDDEREFLETKPRKKRGAQSIFADPVDLHEAVQVVEEAPVEPAAEYVADEPTEAVVVEATVVEEEPAAVAVLEEEPPTVATESQGRILSELPHPSDPHSVRNDGFGYPPGRPRSQWDVRVIRGLRNRRRGHAMMKHFNVR